MSPSVHSGDLVGHMWSSDIVSENRCSGTIWTGCGRVTRCGLDWSYPQTGELCLHDDDGGTDGEDAGAADVCER